MNKMRSIIMIGLALIVFYACKKDKDQVPLPAPITNAPELITSMVLVFTDSANTTNKFTAEFRDPDGNGGNSPTKFDTIKLNPGKTYSVSIVLLDETKNPVDTVSKEVEEEKNDHMFFFEYTNVSITKMYLDIDGNGYPVGLLSKWKTGPAGSGTSKVTLKHQSGTKNGTIAPGETDSEVIFQTKIQ